jgi:hypothetical protein
MSPTTDASTSRSPSGVVRRVPVYVWILVAFGGLAGALLAEPGDFWGNTVPSTLTFLVAGLVLGLAAWGISAVVRRR